MANLDFMKTLAVAASGLRAQVGRVRIISENNIPVIENPPLARALHGTVELDQEIPQEHYRAAAEIIGYVMRLHRSVQWSRT